MGITYFEIPCGKKLEQVFYNGFGNYYLDLLVFLYRQFEFLILLLRGSKAPCREGLQTIFYLLRIIMPTIIKPEPPKNLLEVHVVLGFRHTDRCYEAIAYSKISGSLLGGFRDRLGCQLNWLKERVTLLLRGER
jgi:hypothetical protein